MPPPPSPPPPPSQVDYDLILSLLYRIFETGQCGDGSVLIFLPGWFDISQLTDILRDTREFSNTQVYDIIQLHSGVTRKSQARAFEKLKPGMHKIILSTNIAETSITIDDVAVVIDSGPPRRRCTIPTSRWRA